ncbi:hypothetical protein IV203_021742 [Nitzschia inconspicua]|uniref:Uncharacterized protein n=1 Tax=Nitzschia inconspicua TaxID=303405 RepID=A0A9K3KIJ1_9STRA|nr:hypothetical protein IV203_021742 [Nitzschia inconspicua]
MLIHRRSPLQLTFSLQTPHTVFWSSRRLSDGIATPVATKQRFSYKVTAPITGSLFLWTFTMSDLGDVTTNDLAADLTDGITGKVNPGLNCKVSFQWNPRSILVIPFHSGTVTTLSDFDAEITIITIECENCIGNGQYRKTGISKSSHGRGRDPPPCLFC